MTSDTASVARMAHHGNRDDRGMEYPHSATLHKGYSAPSAGAMSRRSLTGSPDMDPRVVGTRSSSDRLPLDNAYRPADDASANRVIASIGLIVVRKDGSVAVTRLIEGSMQGNGE